MSRIFPLYFGGVAEGVGPTSEDEEKVGKAVEVFEDDVADVFVGGEGDGDALRTPTNSAGVVKDCGRAAAAGENEIFQGIEKGLDGIDMTFEEVDGTCIETLEILMAYFKGGGEIRANSEELILDLLQDRINLVSNVEGPADSDDAIKLVDGAVGFYS
jgi:hypothetical protein